MSDHPDFSHLNYQVIRELGRNREGGRISYLANCANLSQKVVIKQFRFLQAGASWQGFKAYKREIAILQELNHPRIPQYLDSFETEDGFCMVQEYQDCPSLANRNSFQPEEIKQIIISVLEILVTIQSRVPPIIHRDIKPENILVDSFNKAYLIDFGLARVNNQELALSSVVAGTPGFMPPEELFNRPLTTASDLYSLGATAIALLTNTSSVKISNLIDDRYEFKFSHLVPGINPDFVSWLQKMVAPNLKNRYSNAASALKELKSIEITGKAKLKPQVQNRPILTIAASVATLIGILIYSNFQPADRSVHSNTYKHTRSPSGTTPQFNQSKLSSEQQWFNRIKPSCNSLEIVTAMAKTTYPRTPTGIGYAASCYALAGRLDLADELIQELSPNLRVYAAQVVFNIGHPVADAGDDRSAGKIMNLVLKYWPENYMALYHAGMSAYVLGEYAQATMHLKDFLDVYQRNDGWTNKAKLALGRIEQNIPADKSFSKHH
ncbi:MAG: protein kinase [Xenococcaceae cyanobacterium MO_188.B29]|nr:protein kinase [Xenococcaceae cyanobacterium MO_188.B29]